MVHGAHRQAVEQVVASALERSGLADQPHAVLFSRRRFKQTGGRRFAAAAPHRARSGPCPALKTCGSWPTCTAVFRWWSRALCRRGPGLGTTEQDVLQRLQRLLDDGYLTRFGPLFQIERAGGQFVLAALSAPEAE